MIERDVIHAQSCYQEDGEKVRRQEARKEIRTQGCRQEGHAQRRGEESLCKEDDRQKDRDEEISGQKGLGEEVGRQARSSQAQEGNSNADAWIVGHVAGRLTASGVPEYWLIRRGCRRRSLA